MQKRLCVIFVFSLIESILSYCMGGYIDTCGLNIDQIVSDITLEIVPCPYYPNSGCLPYPNPYVCLDGAGQGGYYPECYGLYDPSLQGGMNYPSCGSCFDNPFEGMCPSCSCYRDIRDPCLACEDTPLYICFEGCSVDYIPSPYIYFPPVEYPMSAMDIRPYYYGQCWCS